MTIYAEQFDCARLRRATTRSVFSAGLLFCFAAFAGSAYGQISVPAYSYINTVAGNGSYGYSGDGGLATSAKLHVAIGVAVDASGNLYLADADNYRIRKVMASTGIITTVAGNGTAGYSGDGGLATSAKLNYLAGVALDASGNIYISDSVNNRIRKVMVSTGIITTVAGTGTAGYNGDSIAATAAELNEPNGIVLDGYGNLYIADYDNNRIRKVTASTGIITTVAGTGTAGYNGDAILATSAKLNYPEGLALDGYGNIYIGDYLNNRIREVTVSSGMITTAAGDGAAGYAGDGGLAIVAELYYPSGVAVDVSGDIYIADSNNQRIRKVTSGNISTVAGDGTAGYSGDGGFATSAKLNYPNGVALDAHQNIYIADLSNWRIRAVGGQLTTTTFNPLYKVVSILYSPPGNQSGQAYGTSTTNSTTTTVGSSFTFGNTTTFSTGIPSIITGGASMGTSSTATDSYAFTESFTDATNITTDDNSNSEFNSIGLNGSTLSDALNHNLDTFEIWLNPLVTFESNGTTPVSYTVSSEPITINGEPAPYAAVLGVPAIVMEAAPAGVTPLNPTGAAGVTTVPWTWLVPQAYAQTSGVNAYGPGLAAICANTALYQQQLAEDLANPSDPTITCTQTNQCGCTPADFAGILETNPLLNYNSTTHTASPYAGTVSPLQADSLATSSGPGSGAAACGLNAVLATSNCRYVVVPYPGTNTPETGSENAVPLTEPLFGTEYPTFTLNDQTTTAETIGGSTSTSTSIFVGGGPLFGNLKYQATWTWTDMQSIGNAYGSANSMAATFKTSTAACDENVSVYEDTVYHTFVFQIPTGDFGCN